MTRSELALIKRKLYEARRRAANLRVLGVDSPKVDAKVAALEQDYRAAKAEWRRCTELRRIWRGE